LTIGDLNGDGSLDLVTAGQSSALDGYVTVRLGRGDGTFGNAVSYLAESNVSRSVSLGDLNGDDVLDIISAGVSDGNDVYATVRLGQGNGTFGAATSYTTESFRSWALALGDMNGDGRLDLVTAGVSDANDGYATVRLGEGTGSLLAPLHLPTSLWHHLRLP
jgi:hypothetical protein